MTRNETDIGMSLAEDFVAPQSAFDKHRTKTTHFLLNTVLPKTELWKTGYFVNAFINDVKFSHRFVRPVFVLFKVKHKDSKWEQILQRLRAKEEYIIDYFCGVQNNKNLIMVVLQVPKKYESDYNLFLKGHYSKFSDDYKATFKKTITNEKGKPEESIIWKVIHKSPELKEELEKYFTARPSKPYIFNDEDELWGAPQDEYEVYRYKKPIDVSYKTR